MAKKSGGSNSFDSGVPSESRRVAVTNVTCELFQLKRARTFSSSTMEAISVVLNKSEVLEVPDGTLVHLILTPVL